MFALGDCNAGSANDGCETDLASSTDHCGACGQSCEEKSCSFGSCHDPEQVLAEAKSEEQKDALDEWKQEVLMSMDKWEAENIGGKGEQTKRRMAPRLVRKVATVTTAAPTK